MAETIASTGDARLDTLAGVLQARWHGEGCKLQSALGELMLTDIHALKIRARVPDEA